MKLRWDQDASIHVRDAAMLHAEASKRLGGPPATVLDLGAHIGAFTVQAALLGAFVVAVEADPETCDWLRRNVRDHKVERRVVVINAAVAAFSGETREIHYLAGGQSSTLYSKRLDGLGRKNTVPTVGFEWLCAMRGDWDMLKCDVEGSEWEFLGTEAEDTTELDLTEALRGFRYVDLEVHELTNRDFFDGTKGRADVEELRRWVDSCGFSGEPEPHPLMIRRTRIET